MKFLTKATVAAALFTALTTSGAWAKAQTYQIESGHTSVVVSWNHFGFSNPTATLSDVTGTIQFDEQAPEKSKVSVTIPVKTIDTRVDALTKEFMGSEYFDVAKFPTATFVSSSVTATGDDNYDVTGALTIKGHTKTVVLHAHLNHMGEHPMAKKPAVGFDATTSIKRSDFDLKQYVPYVSDAIAITISTEAISE